VIPTRNDPIRGACEKSIHTSTKSYARWDHAIRLETCQEEEWR
jgi:hypothetical protein